jgi:hypothetical protein
MADSKLANTQFRVALRLAVPLRKASLGDARDSFLSETSLGE